MDGMNEMNKSLPPPFPMAFQQLENTYFTEEQLQNTPSRREGVEEAVENDLRIFGCDLIQKAGILLKLYDLFCFIGLFD
jgi:hypothetical protein